MASSLKQTRVRQKQRLLNQLAKRKAALIAAGADEEKIRKDTVVKHLLAQIKRTSRAIAAVEVRQKIMNAVAVQKREQAAQAAEQLPKGKKEKQRIPVSAKDSQKEKKQKRKQPAP